MPLKISLLGRTQGLVKQDFGSARLRSQQLDFVRLATANEQRRIRRTAFAGHTRHRRQASRLCEQSEFIEFAIKIRQPQIDTNQNCQGLRGFMRGSQTRVCMEV